MIDRHYTTLAATATTNIADSVVGLCDMARHKEARDLLSDLDTSDPVSLLAFGMVETALGDQSKAKDYLSQSVRLFGDAPLADKARVQLAMAYWRAGESLEAKALLAEVPERFDSLLSRAIIETESRPQTALTLLTRAAKFEVLPAMEGRLHNQRAMALRKLRKFDRAIIEYEAAVYCFEQSRSLDCVALTAKNLGGLLTDKLQFEKAHVYVDRAIAILGHQPHVARAYDQKALILLAEKRFADAEKVANRARLLLEDSDMKAWLAEILITHARALAELDKDWQTPIRRAREIAAHLDSATVRMQVAKGRKEIAETVLRHKEIAMVELALEQAGGSFRGAAEKIGTSHDYILKAVKKYGILRKPKRLHSIIPSENP